MPDEIDKSIRESSDLQSNLGEAADKFKELSKNAGHITTEVKNINSLSTELNNILKENLSVQTRIGKEYIKLSNISKEINKFKDQGEKIDQRLALLSARASSVDKTAADIAAQRFKNIKSLSAEIVELNLKQTKGVATAQDLLDLATKQAQILREQSSLNGTLNRIGGGLNAQMVRQLAMLKFQKLTTEEMVNKNEELLKIQEKFNARYGGFVKFAEAMSKIPILGNLINSEKILEKMTETAGRGREVISSYLSRITVWALVHVMVCLLRYAFNLLLLSPILHFRIQIGRQHGRMPFHKLMRLKSLKIASYKQSNIRQLESLAAFVISLGPPDQGLGKRLSQNQHTKTLIFWPFFFSIFGL